ncbi:MAG: glycoside hydrolase family 20 zincin-like fold domain-containing protein [Ginsengibacter sp.]
MKKPISLLFLLMASFGCFAQKDSGARVVHIIPEPVSLKVGQGYFRLSGSTKIVFTNEQTSEIATMMTGMLNIPTGYHLLAKTGKEANSNAIILRINNTPDSILGKEGYTLQVTSKKIIIAANQPHGLFYGM